MIQISYISKATQSMSEDDLEEILRISRENNGRLGITGMLLYGNNTFVQILEGEEKAVNELIDKPSLPRYWSARKPRFRRSSSWTQGCDRARWSRLMAAGASEMWAGLMWTIKWSRATLNRVTGGCPGSIHLFPTRRLGSMAHIMG